MRSAFGLGVAALLVATLAVFSLVPALILVFGYDPIIFDRGELRPQTLALNAALALPLFLAIVLSQFLPGLRPGSGHQSFDTAGPRKGGSQDLTDHRIGRPAWLAALVLAWACLFVLTGGLDYRELDVEQGYGSRSRALQLTLTATNVIVMGACALAIEGGRSRFAAWAAWGLLALLAALLALSDSRGLVLQLLLTVWVARYLLGTQEGQATGGAHLLPERLRARWGEMSERRRLLSLTGVGLALGLVALLGIWGARRENEQDAVFSALFRASEPYWHYAYLHFQLNGPDPTVLTDALARIASIPGRWLGLEYPQSIDGAEEILEVRLGVPFSEGVSLPITYIGEGLLYAGHAGALLFQCVVLLLVYISFRCCAALPGLTPSLKAAFTAALVVKCLFLYPKSLSGVVLVLFYESLRDGVALLLLSTVLGRESRHVDPQ